jgi:2-keto-4-pentenoate hydratase/2-oxohepta-3-ene-1,7-dioic acid hydratase in catechol pathway
MKLISYTHGGSERHGLVVGAGIVDLTIRGIGTSVHDLLRSGGDLRQIEDAHGRRQPDVGLDEVRFLPPVLDPGKIVCVGLNYHRHLAETGREPVQHPTLFARWPDSHVGHGEAMVRPSASDKFDFEGELALIVGRAGRAIPKARAFEHVAGYACYNDGSLRDWQRHTTQFLPGKNFARSGAFGPWLVSADEVGDPSRLTLTTRLNGAVVQQASVAQLIFDIPTLVAYVSTFTPLAPGDVIVTGTPDGVGAFREPKLWMKPGDRVEVDVPGVGLLANPIVDEAAGMQVSA